MITLLSLNFSFPLKANTKKIEETKLLQIKQEELPNNSVFSNLKSSGPIVLGVLLLLVFLSITCWALAISKMIYLEKINRKNSLFIKKFWQKNSLKKAYTELSKEEYCPAKEVFRESYQSFQNNAHLSKEGLHLEALMHVSISGLSRSIQNAKRNQRKKLERYLPLLAITASTAPFIGLFGTVWGIMNSFQSIAVSRNTSLAIVAPGIAEALFATALGLLAAIPAVIAYNKFGNDSKKYSQKLENFSKRFISII